MQLLKCIGCLEAITLVSDAKVAICKGVTLLGLGY
uniref:Uncharacterized protein n=1 Tax=Arundo donax TaxID=35708 RepID=A0A0A9C9B3_ARUDO